MTEGIYHYLTVRCQVEKLDAPGQWTVNDCKFTPLDYNGDFLFEKIKDDE
jgi:hypothetical protein